MTCPPALFLALVMPLAPGGTATMPCVVIHPPSLSAEAGEITEAIPEILERQQGVLGGGPLPGCRIHLVARLEDMPGGLPTGSVPEWAAGIAWPSQGAIVIRPERVGRYTQRRLLSVLSHELAHLITHEAAGQGAARLPAWFREGVAANMAREGEWQDFFYLWVSRLATSDEPLSELSSYFDASGSPVLIRAAYAGSFSFVGFIIRKHSVDLPSRVLAGLREGLDFETAYARAAGTTLEADAAAWSSSIRGRNRWLALLTSSITLWMGITLLATLAYLWKKRRSRKILERWEAEDPFD